MSEFLTFSGHTPGQVGLKCPGNKTPTLFLEIQGAKITGPRMCSPDTPRTDELGVIHSGHQGRREERID